MSDDATKSPKKSLSVFNPNDKVQQLRDAFEKEGGPHPEDSVNVGPSIVNPPAPEDQQLREQVIDALRTVFDPEIPVNVYDLGLIYTIDIDVEHRVKIRMTLTAPGCPVAGQIVADVETSVENVDAVKSCDVELVFDPPWTKERMSEAALLELGFL